MVARRAALTPIRLYLAAVIGVSTLLLALSLLGQKKETKIRKLKNYKK